MDNPTLYGRRGGIYQDGNGNNWCDNALRFALLNHMAEEISDGAADDLWRPDIVHVHDWHAALLPFLLSTRKRRPATVLTIHNLAYQGIFAPETLQHIGMSDQPKAYAALEFYGRLSFLKAGICSADAVTTVSPTYAKEVLTPEYGCGLDAVLRKRVNISGIMNGADYSIWAPSNDPHLARTYSSTHIAGKRACKIALQDEIALNPSSEKPLVAFMSRLAHQKMPDVVLEALPPLLAEGIQFALVAEGDSHYERGFRELAAAYPGQVSVHVGYDEPLAHRVLAGADILLHPSRYEPCGLMPIYAMRYGTLPLVRKCGGTADSVVDAIEDTVNCGKATGFSFEHATARDLIECLRRSLHLYRQPIVWRKIQICAMRQDFGWERPAQAYVDLYRTLTVRQTGERILQERRILETTNTAFDHAEAVCFEPAN